MSEPILAQTTVAAVARDNNERLALPTSSAQTLNPNVTIVAAAIVLSLTCARIHRPHLNYRTPFLVFVPGRQFYQ